MSQDSRPGADDQPTSGGSGPTQPAAPLSPGDEAPEGTPGTGENICPACGGSGSVAGQTCRECSGTGKVTVGIGGA